MFGNTQYTLLDIQELYGYYSIEQTIQKLWRADARLFTYSKKDITAYGKYDDILESNHIEIKNKNQIKTNSDKFQITQESGLYRLDREILDNYFNFEKRKFIPAYTEGIIQPKVGSMTIKGYLHFDLYPENILVDEVELFTTLGAPPPKDKRHPFYYAFEQDDEEWTAIYEHDLYKVSKDFSYYEIPNYDRFEITGLKKELFELIFDYHCDMKGRPFKSGEIMGKLKIQHSYKSFSDFLSKNKDLKLIIVKVNNKGYWRMKFPVFENYNREVVIPRIQKEYDSIDFNREIEDLIQNKK